MPIEKRGKIYNCAVLLNSGKILGVIPKSYLPNHKEYYEDRWFNSNHDSSLDMIEIANQSVPFGSDILFKLTNIESAVIGLEICEDLWVPLSPHEHQALAGATILVNLSSSNDIVGKADWRKTLVRSESGRCIAAYCYVSAGIGESSNDLVFGGHILMAENGNILKDHRNMLQNENLIISDIDLNRIEYDRRLITSFNQSKQEKSFRLIKTKVDDIIPKKLYRTLEAHPFAPRDPKKREERCCQIFSMQIAALAKKLSNLEKKYILIGVSGGLDSTLALLVASKTMDFLKLPRTNIYACNLPGFGTTQKTKSNAFNLSKALRTSFQEVDITRSCSSHLMDLDHSGFEDVVFENIQARYRTEFLFNKANQIGGLVLGTGDLTEIALGWNTFSGDHMSHYNVNSSIPKTLVRYLIRWVADEEMSGTDLQNILYDVLSTPISPELKRPVNGEISQKSEEIVGPMELADFYLYPFIRFGMSPSKILYLANEVRKESLFDGQYSLDDLHYWLKSFIKRFFFYQFKRTCMPEGPKIGSVSLSPRGDWRMASDSVPDLWIEDLDEMYKKLKIIQ